MPHGVDVDHFATARASGAVPPELQGLARPIVGFTGLIERWIDLDLVGWLAHQLPQVTFVMIGRVAVPAESVPAAPNLHFLGPRPYESLPAYGRCFDAAIIPYRLTDQVHAANPLKLREYLAMGLPTVAVSTPEIDKFAGVVSVTRTREEFLAALVATLAAGSDPELIRRRMDAVKDVSWATRVDELLVSVQSLLVERSRPAPTPTQMRRS
jgi:glycosyltransferase involved in cell wall biosynthesis